MATRLAITAIGLALAAWLLPVVASAQESDADADARAHFQAGRLHFDRGAYEEAQREFEAAYELSQRAELLYNLYLTAERLGQLDEAIAYLERYLAEGSPDEERRAVLPSRLENLRERRARAQADEASGTTPPPEEDAPAPAPRREGDIVPAAIVLGVAGAALVSFAITGGLALAEDSALADGCGATGTCTDAQVSTLSTLNTVADVSWVTAAIATGAGLALLFTLGMPSDAEQETARVVPWVTPDGSAGALAQVRFE